jgi:hypothetical protein
MLRTQATIDLHQMHSRLNGSICTVPSLKEWQQLWAKWELVTLKLVPSEALHEQSIPLQNPLLFYLGHISTL